MLLWIQQLQAATLLLFVDWYANVADRALVVLRLRIRAVATGSATRCCTRPLGRV